MEVTITDGTLKGQIKPILSDGMPTGTVLSFAGNTIPENYLLCDGSAVSRSTYANLFKVIGTTYGAGDGSSTFNLPNLVDRFVEGGSASGAVKNAGLPNITGAFQVTCRDGLGATYYNGAFKATTPNIDNINYCSAGEIKGWVKYLFNASLSNPIYGSSTTVQPPAIVMKYIIKI